MIKERPILFNTDMVRAILEDRKTQTRRVVKPQPNIRTDWIHCEPDPRHYTVDKDGVIAYCAKVKCPYGHLGDRLWVRETWHQDTGLSQDKSVHYKADGDNCYT